MDASVARPVQMPPRKRDVIPPQGLNGYDQCWYPIALSSEVARGQVIGRPFLSGKVVVFRGENGIASVLSAYCSHFGADLSVGNVEGNSLRCAFHRWHYGQDGRCNHIPTGDRIPTGAAQFAFPTQEQAGIIWAFNGETPLYEHPLSHVSDATHVVRPVKIRDFPIDPALFMCNTFDFQHFRVVHGLKPEGDLDPVPQIETYRVGYRINMQPPEGYELRYDLAVVGTNKFLIRGSIDGREVVGIYAGCPTPGNNSMNFMVTATPRASSTEGARAIEDFLDRVTRLRDKIVSEDWPILSTMRQPRYGLLTKSDTALAKFIGYLRNYPRAHPSQQFLD